MNIKVYKSTARGTVTAPPSKSILHRYLICAALSQGSSRLTNISYSEDILATIDCIKALGAEVTANADEIIVEGIGGSLKHENRVFKCRESGSTLRFFLPISLLDDSEAEFFGYGRLLERPLSVYEAIFKEQGISFERGSESIKTKGLLKPGSFTVRGNISSQFITGLMFILPLLKEDSRINIIPPFESRSYILLTMDALRKFGIDVNFEAENTIFIKGNQSYTAANMEVEGDYSNAAFMDAFNYLDGSVNVKGLNEYSLQGDAVYKDLFLRLKNGNCVIDIEDCPDLGPILFVVAALNQGAKFIGTRRLQMKESDRGRVMCEELAKFGVKSTEADDFIEIFKSDIHESTEPVSGANDHRIVMSMTVFLTKVGGLIEGAEAISKSYPDFYERIEELGIGFEEC